MDAGELTRLLRLARAGNKEAEHLLFERVYGELTALARRLVRSEPVNATLTPSALVNETYIRLQPLNELALADRHHLFATSARIMRRLLIDHARARRSLKRGGETVRVQDGECLVTTEAEAEKLCILNDALEHLEAHSPRQSRLVELRFFGGYSLEEAASILNISERTAKRDWVIARTRLKGAMDAG